MDRTGKITAEAADAGERIDVFLAGKTGITRSQVQRLIEAGRVLVAGSAVSSHYRVKANDAIMFALPQKETGALVPEAIPIEILYRDEYVVVVEKPAGMVVYPAVGHAHGTLMNALAHHCGELVAVGGPLRPGVVHRLDRDTSGVMIVALADNAYYSLIGQFRERTIRRKYCVLVFGNLNADTGEIRLPVGRSSSDRKKMSTRVRKGKEAVTRWEVIKRFGFATLIEASLGTGRTHQIRVHFASIGHPVLGDRTYGRKTEIAAGRKKISFPRQMLHARLLGFFHPVSGEYMEFSSPLPEDMKRALDELSVLRA
ncbi:MAG: RluA family pseudouridine synthase [Nitrospirae bacterium]|nr:RluA family pseudouridine synthase [Nitrospirota bacterium]